MLGEGEGLTQDERCGRMKVPGVNPQARRCKMEEKLQNKIVEEVKRYLEKWGLPTDVKIGGNVKKGEDALSVRAFVEVSNLRRIFVEYAGASLRGVPEGYNGFANFFVVPRGDRNVYLYLDDGLIISSFDGKKLIIEVVPHPKVLPFFRYVS
ncbi:hypothetical protein YS40_090 [Thermus phage phiYS40]|uniref:hypothetical protein n=1 Tax=Thermus phage phiYS40 TaxID=407392 RepID=UPI0000E689D0|nr:hypothetical protein YS40_090 [Thermus phage phiYS40]ABJ91484.1 hypothetical protein YS40_090 [Thermus phage phiYS40]BAK53608.1 hypothetical protein YSP_090 [Thermus phage phiYS40]